MLSGRSPPRPSRVFVEGALGGGLGGLVDVGAGHAGHADDFDRGGGEDVEQADADVHGGGHFGGEFDRADRVVRSVDRYQDFLDVLGHGGSFFSGAGFWSGLPDFVF